MGLGRRRLINNDEREVMKYYIYFLGLLTGLAGLHLNNALLGFIGVAMSVVAVLTMMKGNTNA